MRFHALSERFGSAARAWDAMPRGAAHHLARSRALAAEESLARLGGSVLMRGDAAYPVSLDQLPQPPACLFALGRLDLLSLPAAAVVGTRPATPYGERVARELGRAIAAAGGVVVSGLARGIDAAAHRGALEAGGATVAVLGTGVDIAYPPAHRALQAQIAELGLLLSEEPPGERAGPGAFPKRNRIIAALASGVIVVEAGERSGALITAAHAMELERWVAAVPGPIDAPQSSGPNALLRDGAQVVADVADALALLHLTPPVRTRALPDSPAVRAVWDALATGAGDLDSLTTRSRLPACECLAAVTALELAGAVECALTGEVRRRG